MNLFHMPDSAICQLDEVGCFSTPVFFVTHYMAAKRQQRRFGQMSSSSSNNAGTGTTEPGRRLEVNNALVVSAAPLKSGLILNAAALPTDNGWSNIQLVASPTGGSGWLKTYMDNHGGYFNGGVLGVKKVKVTQDNWPDCVLASNYQLSTFKRSRIIHLSA